MVDWLKEKIENGLDWLKKKTRKAGVLAEITASETTSKHRDLYDSIAQHAIRDRMAEKGYHPAQS